MLSIDGTARFYHYGPQGCRSGWVRGSKGPDGREWDTPITWNEDQAWKDARDQLQSRQPEEPAVELTPGEMYPLVTDIEGRMLHSPYCQAVFARRDWRCARCVELQLGALPRKSGHREYFARKLREVQKYFLFPHDAA